MLIDWQNLFAIIRSFLKGSANLNHKLKKTTAAILAALILSSAATGVTAVLSSTQTVAHAATAVPTFTVKTPSTWNNYYTLDFTYANSAYIDAISKITVGDTELSKASGSYSVTGNTYYTRSSDGQLCISPDAIKSGDTITVTATGYEELVLKKQRPAIPAVALTTQAAAKMAPVKITAAAKQRMRRALLQHS